jgi:hypothetical protein
MSAAVRGHPWLGMALAALLLPACDDKPGDASLETVQQRLPGTWLREIDEDGVHVRRILVLEPDGQFRERTRVVDATGVVTEHAHAGEWVFDGTNLKRRYTSMDGKQPSAPTLPYATFELKFTSKHDFTGIDHVRRRQVQYRRVEAGAAP